ncbi:MAG: hypothetical protein IJ586_06335, partial [Alloprevotella sp.]|nr:hypothetical protein [Alloprevotella sp.]
MKTRLLTTLIAVFLALSAWAYDVQIGGIYYDLDSNTKEAAVTSGYPNIKAISPSPPLSLPASLPIPSPASG